MDRFALVHALRVHSESGEQRTRRLSFLHYVRSKSAPLVAVVSFVLVALVPQQLIAEKSSDSIEAIETLDRTEASEVRLAPYYEVIQAVHHEGIRRRRLFAPPNLPSARTQSTPEDRSAESPIDRLDSANHPLVEPSPTQSPLTADPPMGNPPPQRPIVLHSPNAFQYDRFTSPDDSPIRPWPAGGFQTPPAASSEPGDFDASRLPPTASANSLRDAPVASPWPAASNHGSANPDRPEESPAFASESDVEPLPAEESAAESLRNSTPDSASSEIESSHGVESPRDEPDSVTEPWLGPASADSPHSQRTREPFGESLERLPEVDTPQTALEDPMSASAELTDRPFDLEEVQGDNSIAPLNFGGPGEESLVERPSLEPNEDNARLDRTVQSPLPTAPVTPRSPAMNAVADQAGRFVQDGFSLAQRRAYYSARSQFIRAMRTISQALDAQDASTSHAQALAEGLRALEEANDFMPSGSRLEADLDMRRIVAAHRTRILNDEDFDAMSALNAQRRYYTFAQQRLGKAVEGEPVGSMALYGLARVSTALAATAPTANITANLRAMSLHQAALLAHPGNHLAANELGVLLARYQQYEQALNFLTYSARLAPEQATWHNVAAVRQQMGQMELAEQARQQEVRLARARRVDTGPAAASSSVVWLAPAEFARTSDMQGALQNPRTLPPSGQAHFDKPSADPPSPKKQDALGWLLWKSNRK